VVSRPLTFAAEIRTAAGVERRQATAIAVSNNVLGEGHIPFAEAVDRGVLGVYVVEPMPPAELARLLFSLAFGTWKSHPLVSESEVREVSLRFRRRKAGVQAVIDGELVPLPEQVDLAIHPGGLKVVLPAVDQQADSAMQAALPGA